MTDKEACKKQIPNAFCRRACWGGYHVWEEGTARLLAYGRSPAQAWKNCRRDHCA